MGTEIFVQSHIFPSSASCAGQTSWEWKRKKRSVSGSWLQSVLLSIHFRLKKMGYSENERASNAIGEGQILEQVPKGEFLPKGRRKSKKLRRWYDVLLSDCLSRRGGLLWGIARSSASPPQSGRYFPHKILHSSFQTEEMKRGKLHKRAIKVPDEVLCLIFLPSYFWYNQNITMAPIIAVKDVKGDPNIKSDAGALLYV